MKTLRIVLIALVALAVGVMASADAQMLLLTLDTPNPQANAWFGRSLAMGDVNGDGHADIAVGAPWEDGGGQAYVFSGQDGSLLLSLDAPNPQADPLFGMSVAVGDVNGDGRGDIAVGAPGEHVGDNVQQGRAYVFSGEDGSLLFTLDTPNPQDWGYFGWSVAVGDVNGDGKGDIAVGVPGENWGSEINQGRVYVFSGEDGSLLFTRTTPHHQTDAWFGDSVAVGDVNGDGHADIAVGAPQEHVDLSAFQGRAYVFSGEDGSRLFTLETPNPQAWADFGYSVAVGEVNDDGKGDIAVGAPGENVGGNNDQGRAYVFSGAPFHDLLFTLETPNPQADAEFGYSVAVGEMNDDGRGDIAVGAPWEDVGGNADQGRAYVFSGADGSLLFTLNTPNPQASGGFGASVAAGDGQGPVAVGADEEDVGGNEDQGRAYVFFPDRDGDGVPDAEDNCPDVYNPDQDNNDLDYPSPGDGPKGDACDNDDDNDGWEDDAEVPGGGGAGPGDTVGSDPFDPAKTPEVCDGVDNDGNEGIDEGFPDTDFDGEADCHDDDFDADGDGTGNATDTNDDNFPNADPFTDVKENYMGTDKAIMCSAAPAGGPDNDPLDINADGKASITDIMEYFVVGEYGANCLEDDQPYKRRLDLNADGKLSIADIMEYFAFGQYGNACPYGL